MTEWWSKAHQLLLDMKLKQSYIKQAVEMAEVRIRDHSINLMNYCRSHQVPFLLFSAGLASVLEVPSSLQLVYSSLGSSSSEVWNGGGKRYMH